MLKVVCGLRKIWPPTLQQLKGHDDNVVSVAFSPDGSKVVSGSSDETIRVWDASTGAEMLPPLRGHDYSVQSVAFSPDGSKIVSGSDDKTIRVWDASTGVEIVLESDSRSVPVLDAWNVSTGDFRPSARMTTEGLSRSKMDKPMISLVNGWFRNIHTGCYVGRLPVEHAYYRYKMCGSTFVGWTVDHKLVIIQLHAE